MRNGGARRKRAKSASLLDVVIFRRFSALSDVFSPRTRRSGKDGKVDVISLKGALYGG
jgi:hypothetical protein